MRTVTDGSTTETPVVFRRSRRCAAGDCVEIAFTATGSVLVRDSKNPGAAVLTFDAHEWSMFVKGIQDGEFDHPGS